ncbi:MAG: DUF503 domain-containing protein [Solirubrobacteraceae bacterium]
MSSGFVAVLRIELHFPDAGSLKAKRSELKAVKAGLAQRFGAAVAEVDHQDTWQRSTLLASVCAGAEGRAGDHADAIVRWLDARSEAGVRVERRLASWSDMESLG